VTSSGLFPVNPSIFLTELNHDFDKRRPKSLSCPLITIRTIPQKWETAKNFTKEKYFAALRKETSPIPQLPKAVKSKTKKIGGKQAKKTEKPEDEEKKDEASDEAEDSDFGQVVENLKVLKKWKDEAWKEGLDMKLVEETGQSMEDEKEYLQVTSP